MDVGKRFLVGRDGVIEVGGELRVGVRWLVADEEEKEVMRRWATEEKDGGGTGWWEREVGGENEMNVVELLGEMVGGRLRALRAGGVVEEGKEGEVREEVMRICGIYRQGESGPAFVSSEGAFGVGGRERRVVSSIPSSRVFISSKRMLTLITSSFISGWY